jgi:hypothetical protein
MHICGRTSIHKPSSMLLATSQEIIPAPGFALTPRTGTFQSPRCGERRTRRENSETYQYASSDLTTRTKTLNIDRRDKTWGCRNSEVNQRQRVLHRAHTASRANNGDQEDASHRVQYTSEGDRKRWESKSSRLQTCGRTPGLWLETTSCSGMRATSAQRKNSS